MKTITIEITDQEKKSLEFMGDEDIQQWLQQAVQERAKKSMQAIAKDYYPRANKEGVQIPVGIEAIVQDAFARGWVKTKS